MEGAVDNRNAVMELRDELKGLEYKRTRKPPDLDSIPIRNCTSTMQRWPQDEG